MQCATSQNEVFYLEAKKSALGNTRNALRTVPNVRDSRLLRESAFEFNGKVAREARGKADSGLT